jgi:hypothetical protein
MIRNAYSTSLKPVRGFFYVSWISELAGPGRNSKDHCDAAQVVAPLAEHGRRGTQLVVTRAERDGLRPYLRHSVLAGNGTEMPLDAASASGCQGSSAARHCRKRPSRAEVVSDWGREGLVSLAVKIAASRVFPAAKYAFGYGHARTGVNLAGSGIAVPL